MRSRKRCQKAAEVSVFAGVLLIKLLGFRFQGLGLLP